MHRSKSTNPRAAASALALGYAFAPNGLARVRVSLQLSRADEDRILPKPYSADAVRQALVAPPEYHEVAGAGLARCTAAQVPEICAEGEGISRERFHRQFNAEVVVFLQTTLAVPQASGIWKIASRPWAPTRGALLKASNTRRNGGDIERHFNSNVAKAWLPDREAVHTHA